MKRVIDGFTIRTDRETSERMGGVRQQGTKPELVVRELVSKLGHRYTLNNRDLPGSPDLANRTRRWAIFVHGCYWHRHRNCSMATTPTRNRAFWEAKFQANIARDRRAVARLRRSGFRAIVVWECETKRSTHSLRRRLSSLGRAKRR